MFHAFAQHSLPFYEGIAGKQASTRMELSLSLESMEAWAVKERAEA